MEVVHALPCIGPDIGHHPIAAVESLPHGQAPDDLEHLHQNLLVGCRQVGDRRDMLPRDDQQMGRRLGVDVTEGHDPVRAVDHIGIDGTGGDPAEEAIAQLCATTAGSRPSIPSERIRAASTETIEPYRARPSKKTRT